MFAFLHAHHHGLDDRTLLIKILENQNEIMADLTKLQASVAANTEATNAAVKLITSTSPTDQADVDALTSAVDANTAALTAAVAPAPAPAG